MAVFVLDKHKKPLMPCSEKRARQILERGRARVHRLHPFPCRWQDETIRLVDRRIEDSVVEGVTLKIDPGSRETGVAIVREEGTTAHALSFFCLRNRGQRIHLKMVKRAACRRRRRVANLRYRKERYNNRCKPKGWLVPSIRHRVESTANFAAKLMKLAPIQEIHMELAKFDTQKMENPGISGAEYQQGTLAGYEVRQYLLEKWGRKCAYCGKEGVPLEIEHVVPKSRGGSDRVSNLALACHECNQAKDNLPVEEFLNDKPDLLRKIKKQAKMPLRDATAMNATRWALYRKLQEFDLPIYVATGGCTKWNRSRLGVRKEHWLDALCVGDVDGVTGVGKPCLMVISKGRGAYLRTRFDEHGFPRTRKDSDDKPVVCGKLMKEKTVHGFATGDLVRAVVPSGKKKGEYIGRVAVRKSGRFNIQSASGVIQGISWRHCRIISRCDGYGYEYVTKELSGG